MDDPVALIRATHPYAFRSGQWARLAGTVDDPATGRRCWSVQFPDGESDFWPVDDGDHQYEQTTGWFLDGVAVCLCDPRKVIHHFDVMLGSAFADSDLMSDADLAVMRGLVREVRATGSAAVPLTAHRSRREWTITET